MSQSIKPTAQRSTSTSSQPIAPHPPLCQYYDEIEARQGFLNELFNRTAYQYRNIDKATGFGYGLWYRRKSLKEAGLKAAMHVLDVACGPGLAPAAGRPMGQELWQFIACVSQVILHVEDVVSMDGAL